MVFTFVIAAVRAVNLRNLDLQVGLGKSLRWAFSIAGVVRIYFVKDLKYIVFLNRTCKVRVAFTLKAKHIFSVFYGKVPRMQPQPNWPGIRVKRVWET